MSVCVHTCVFKAETGHTINLCSYMRQYESNLDHKLSHFTIFYPIRRINQTNPSFYTDSPDIYCYTNLSSRIIKRCELQRRDWATIDHYGRSCSLCILCANYSLMLAFVSRCSLSVTVSRWNPDSGFFFSCIKPKFAPGKSGTALGYWKSPFRFFSVPAAVCPSQSSSWKVEARSWHSSALRET